MIDYKTIGRKIRERRIACNLSQEKLAELCDVGTTHISHIETGNCIPSLKVFIAILSIGVQGVQTRLKRNVRFESK